MIELITGWIGQAPEGLEHYEYMASLLVAVYMIGFFLRLMFGWVQSFWGRT